MNRKLLTQGFQAYGQWVAGPSVSCSDSPECCVRREPAGKGYIWPIGERHRSFNAWPDHICLNSEIDIKNVLFDVYIFSRLITNTICSAAQIVLATAVEHHWRERLPVLYFPSCCLTGLVSSASLVSMSLFSEGESERLADRTFLLLRERCFCSLCLLSRG